MNRRLAVLFSVDQQFTMDRKPGKVLNKEHDTVFLLPLSLWLLIDTCYNIIKYIHTRIPIRRQHDMDRRQLNRRRPTKNTEERKGGSKWGWEKMAAVTGGRYEGMAKVSKVDGIIDRGNLSPSENNIGRLRYKSHHCCIASGLERYPIQPCYSR